MSLLLEKSKCFLMKKICFGALFLLFHISVFSQTTIFPFSSNWKYEDDGSDQGTAWRSGRISMIHRGQVDAGKLGFGNTVSTT